MLKTDTVSHQKTVYKHVLEPLLIAFKLIKGFQLCSTKSPQLLPDIMIIDRARTSKKFQDELKFVHLFR